MAMTRAEVQRAYRIRHPERIRAARAANPERFRKASREYRARNLEKVRAANRAQSRRRWPMRRLAQYGLTVEQYGVMLNVQGGACAVCKIKPINGRLCIDHDHGCCSGERSCGKCVCGLLCDPCNVQLGLAERGLAGAALEYLGGGGGAVWRFH